MLSLRSSVLLSALLLTAAGAANSADYTVTLDAEAEEIRVRACFSHLPASLSSGNRASAGFLDPDRLQHVSLSSYERRLRTTGNPCLSYVVELNKARAAQQARKGNGAWLVNNRSWLWRPRDGQTIHLAFVDPAGKPMAVSAPWPSVRRNGQRIYQAGSTPLRWTSRMAFGNVTVRPISVSQQTLNVAFVGIDNQKKRSELVDWLTEAAGTVANLYGRYPIDEAQVLVVPIGKRSEAVPWAEVQRAGRPAVHLFIDASRPIREFREDWTAVHELSHLLLPRVAYRDRWVSEGIASYYQHVAKARAGMFSAETGWQKLKAGFARGRKVEKGTLRTSNQTRHVYWGGAAVFLLADLRLRELPQPQTLEKVLAKLQACCLPSDEMWSAETLFEKLDELSNTRIFTDLLNNEATRARFPVSVAFERGPDPLLQKHLTDIFSKRILSPSNSPLRAEDD